MFETNSKRFLLDNQLTTLGIFNDISHAFLT